MEFHQLRYFVAAAETQSMTRAAERLHVSQPALSRQIALLEEEIGVLLFQRLKQRITLTDAGRFFLAKTRQLLCDAETATQQVRERFNGERKTLRLGFIGPFLDDLVAPAVREFQQRHPKSQVSLYDLPPSAQIQRLRANELDAAILANIDESERTRFSVQQLSKHRMAVVVPAEHRLAHRKAVKLGELSSEPWVSLSNEVFPGRREFLLESCGKAGFVPQLHAELDSLPLMLAAVATTSSVALIPAHARKLPHSGCVFLTLSTPVITTQLLLIKARAQPGTELACLLSLLAEHAAALADA
jgi:DNA-binding transcriptional LysR family regulator